MAEERAEYLISPTLTPVDVIEIERTLFQGDQFEQQCKVSREWAEMRAVERAGINKTRFTETRPAPRLGEEDSQRILDNPFFALEVVTGAQAVSAGDTHGASFHALTLVQGQAEVHSGGEQVTLNRFDSVIVAAGAGAYEIRPLGAYRLLRALAGQTR